VFSSSRYFFVLPCNARLSLFLLRLERMRDNCDTNAQLLTQILTLIEPEEGPRPSIVSQSSIKPRSRFNRVRAVNGH
jgi:hypothetical protein